MYEIDPSNSMCCVTGPENIRTRSERFTKLEATFYHLELFYVVPLAISEKDSIDVAFIEHTNPPSNSQDIHISPADTYNANTKAMSPDHGSHGPDVSPTV